MKSHDDEYQLEMFPVLNMDTILQGVEQRKREVEEKAAAKEKNKNLSTEELIKELQSAPEHYGKTYSSFDFAEFQIHGNEFEGCFFKGCHFVKVNLTAAIFRDCTFENCDFVLCRLENTVISDSSFTGCKLLGLQFGGCSRYSFFPKFTDCLINNCVFEGNNLKNVETQHCTVRETEYLGCDLTDSNFDGTSFESTNFEGCQFEHADFTSAHGYAIDPYCNKIKKGRFSLPEAQSFLWFLEIELE